MNNVRQLFIPKSAMQAIEQAGVQDDNPERKPPGGGNGEPPLEARIAKLESTTEFIQRDMTEIKTDIREIKRDMRTDFRLVFGALITVALGLTAVMAKGFGWL